MLASSGNAPGNMMLAMVSGAGKLICDAKWRGAVTHSAIKGQSLLQSGTDALPGQQGIWSIASAESFAAAAFIPVGVSIAIVGRAIGASNRPATATHAKNRLMVARILTSPPYHGWRVVQSGVRLGAPAMSRYQEAPRVRALVFGVGRSIAM